MHSQVSTLPRFTACRPRQGKHHRKLHAPTPARRGVYTTYSVHFLQVQDLHPIECEIHLRTVEIETGKDRRLRYQGEMADKEQRTLVALQSNVEPK